MFDFYTVIFYGLTVPKQVSSKKSPKKETVWKPTQVQFLYRHKNGRYYVRTFASGKEKWTRLRSTALSRISPLGGKANIHGESVLRTVTGRSIPPKPTHKP